MSKKNILYVHNANFNFIGANKLQVMNMCNAFVDSDCNISLLSFGDLNLVKNKYLFNSKVNTILLKSSLNYYFRTLKLFFRTLNFKSYDMIFSRDLVYTFLIKLFNSKLNIIYELHEIKSNKLWLYMFKKTFNKINHVVVISNGIKNKLIEQGFNKNKIVVLHDGVDLERFNLDLSSNKAKEKLNLSNSEKIILYIGSFQDWKGYKTFLESSKLNLDKSIKFYCIGGNEYIIKKLTLEFPDVEFKTFVDSNLVPVWLKASDILVIPNSGISDISKFYTSPLKLFEYMASNTPIIASNLPSIKDIVSKSDVIFFKSDDFLDLFNKIQIVLNDSHLSNLLTKNSFKKVKNYTWKKRVSEILKLK
jgi:glycosyltransferase involved in cell wall biosynthesis